MYPNPVYKSKKIFFIFKSDKAAATFSSTNVEIVMKVLIKRLKSRTALANQLQQLGKYYRFVTAHKIII